MAPEFAGFDIGDLSTLKFAIRKMCPSAYIESFQAQILFLIVRGIGVPQVTQMLGKLAIYPVPDDAPRLRVLLDCY